MTREFISVFSRIEKSNFDECIEKMCFCEEESGVEEVSESCFCENVFNLSAS
jgi:hypothetical protein